MRSLVGDNRVQFSITQRGLIDTEMAAYILGEDAPLPGMQPLSTVFPLPVTAQMTFVLTLKQIAVYIEEPFKRAARNRVSVQAYLLKKPQTLSRNGYLQLLNPNVWRHSCRSLLLPIGVALHEMSSCDLRPGSP